MYIVYKILKNRKQCYSKLFHFQVHSLVPKSEGQLQNFKERNFSKYVVSQVFKIGKKQMFVLIFFLQTIALNFE